MRSRLLPACFAGVVAPALALAQPGSAPGTEQPQPSQPPERSLASPLTVAEGLVQQGIEERKAGDDRAALQSFRRAYEIGGSPRALAQLALAEQALGLWLDAHEHLSRALDQKHPWIAEHRPALSAALEEISSELGSVEVSSNVDGAEIYVDGRWLGRTPSARPFRVVAGQSVIEVKAPGHFTLARPVQVARGGLARIDVALTPEPPPPVPAGSSQRPVASEAAVQAPSPVRDALMYGSVGLSALGLAVGVTGYVVREINVAVYNDDSRCDVRPELARSEECASEARAWRVGENLAIAGLTAAAVFGGVGLYLWLDRPEGSSTPEIACRIGVGALSCASRF